MTAGLVEELPALVAGEPIPFALLDTIKVKHIGPTWERNPEWDGVSLLGKHGKYILPLFTLGYEAWAWVRENLLSPDSTDTKLLPFEPTFEQYRFVLWWYAIDERGRFLFRRGVLQRLKGWGKDPLAAVISAIELLGPCRFRGWANRDMPERGLDPQGRPLVRRGSPVGQENGNAWIQVAAVTRVQTQNTMGLFPSMFRDELKQRAQMRDDSIGIMKVSAFKGKRQIQAVTSNPRALEGGRPSLIIKNETEHWVSTNNGWEMDAAIDRNAAKSKGGAARSLAICNAPEPSEESIGLKERNAYLAEVEGRAFKTGVLYDSLELTEDVSLFPPGLDKLEPEDQEPLVYEWIQHALKLARGDAWWLDPERIAQDVLDGKMAASISRRFFFNQTVVSEESWVLPQAVDLAVDPLVGALRTPDCDQLRVGWSVVRSDEPVVMFFDGSKSDDATSLTGCRLSDGYCFQIGIWQQPPGIRRGRNMWRSPRGEVDSRVDEAFERFNIVAFWGDPSHAKDDEDGAGYWDGLFDEWHRRYKSRLLHWSIKTGVDQHSILWDMSAPHRTKQFVQAAERVVTEFEYQDENGDLAPQFSIDGHPLMRDHLKNTQMAPNQFGVGMRKESRTSLRKIDAAVTLVGARMLRRFVLNAEPEEEEEKGGWAESW